MDALRLVESNAAGFVKVPFVLLTVGTVFSLGKNNGT